ncbi:MAG: GTPase Era [Pseudobdellovibrionaceae bacterium]
MSQDMNTRCGFVAILGATNAGKSTLTNLLVGEHVSIVTQKVQTTRFPVRGICLADRAQIILVDTPGLFDAHGNEFQGRMISSALSAGADADRIVFLVDAAKVLRHKDIRPSELPVDALRGKSVWLAFNKIDEVEKQALLDLSARYNAAFPFEETFFISAKTGDGVEHLKERLAQSVPEGPWLFPEDTLTDLPVKLLTAERTREAAFERLHQELPYNLAVVTETIEDEGTRLVISQVIYIKSEKHKPIIVGKGGATIKAIGSKSRRAIEQDLDCKVHLSLFVKVKSNWDRDRELLSSWSLDE